MNRFAIVGFGVLALVGVYSIIVGRPPFYSAFVPYEYPSYTPPPSSYTPPSTPDTSYSDPASPYGSAPDPLGLSGDVPAAPADPSPDYAQDYSQTAPPQENIEIWPEQTLPANGETQAYTFDEAIAPFKIQSQGISNFLVKLTDVNTGATVMTIFVRGGQDVETTVPLGSYYVKYASGTTWYGYDHLFGDYHTGYSKADEVFNFSVDGDTVRGFSITLYAVEGGNLTTSGITASEF